MNEQVQRVIVDYKNESPGLQPAEFNYNNAFANIVEDASQYNLSIENSEIDLSNMILDNKPKYSVCLFSNDKSETNLKYGPNYFNISDTSYSPLYTISDFLNWLFSITTKQTKNPIITYSLNPDSELFYYTLTEEQYNNYFVPMSGTSDLPVQVYFNSNFLKIFPDFMNTKNPITLAESEDTWYQLSGIVSPTTTTPAVVYAKTITVTKMMMAKRIEFSSTLQTTDYLVYDKNLGKILRRNILSTILLNSENYNILNKTNMMYVPNVFREITFTNDKEINRFTISVYIYYNDGSRVLLTLSPGDYFSMTLAFTKLK